MNPAPPPASPPASFAGPPAGRWSPAVVAVVIAAAALAAYFPALAGEFLWDDAGHVTNRALQPWSGLWRIWFEPGATQQYYPLLHSVFWIEHRLWGDAPFGYHLINVLWHTVSACLLVAILRRLAVPGAVLAGLVFSLHPVAVESVAWIAEQKNTLSTVFYLAAALGWLRFEAERRPARYAVAGLWFLAALLTKSVAATLPGALLVIAWWRRGRLEWRRDVRPLLPWFAASVVAGLFTIWFERFGIGARGTDFGLGWIERTVLAGRVVWFYFGKLVWPVDLAFFYPRWEIDASSPFHWLFPLGALALLAVAAWWARRERGPLAAALLYGGTLVPVLGFVNVYPFIFSYVADHFQYQASLGMLAFLAAALARGFSRLGWPRWTGPGLAAGGLLLLGGLTWRQAATYRDVFSLYEATLARNPSSWVAHLNLGTALDDAGEPGKGLPHLRRALELRPAHPETLNSIASVLNQLGRAAEAHPLVEQAILIQPRFAAAHNTLGITLMALGRESAGVAAFARAVELDPALPGVQVNFAWALATCGRLGEAIAQFERARQRDPDSADLEFKWGTALARHGRPTEATVHLWRAVELRPHDPFLRNALATVLLELGRPKDAAAQFERVLELDPDNPTARHGLRGLAGR